jgi:hypothetical protein
VASHLFLDGAATPPVSGGELPASAFIHSFYDNAYKGSFMCFATASSERRGKPPLRVILLLERDYSCEN